MDRIIVSNALKSELDALYAPVELVDTTGAPIGQFVPHCVKLEHDDCPYSESELEQARAERGGRPLAEIWKSLNAK
ncbi:MAG: hypothetical protein ACLP9L_42010 [Thermoguttaceae bacterium]